MELEQYLGLFIDESKENLQKLNESLLKLEANTDDLEILNDIFRVAHTLKGMSKTMGFNNIGDLTHNMENVLDPLRSGTLKANNKIIDTLFKCLDKLEELISNVIDNIYEDKASSIQDLVQELQDLLNNAEFFDGNDSSKETGITFNEFETALVDNAKEKGFRPIEAIVFVSKDCVLPGVRAYMVVRAVESIGEIVKTNPATELLENGDFPGTFKLFLVTTATDESVVELIKDISEIDEVKISPFDVAAYKKEAKEPKEVPVKEEIVMQKDEESDSAEAAVTTQSQAVVTQLKAMPQTIRVNASRLDKLMNLVGELVISRTRIAQLTSEKKLAELGSNIGLMGNITSDIQEIVMKLRMVPIEQVFNRFPRLVRDLSKSQKKEVNLKITGKETEIDRVVIDEIGDPLVHLIRNSLDHGLEIPEERIKAGKPAKGTLELAAFNEGDNILIKVTDDGRGIDPDKVKAVAIEKGILSREAAKNMTEREATELIFAPGFSTAKVATDISGRGVGMDVVKSKVCSLGGSVSISSKVGSGTSILISLPSTMAIVQALLIKVGDETYATPLNYISEVIDITRDQIRNIQNKEVIILRGTTLPILRLNKLLQVPSFVENADQSATVMIVRSQGKYLGVIVSELLGQQEVVIKPINKKLCKEEYISGATTLGNGQVALIININALF